MNKDWDSGLHGPSQFQKNTSHILFPYKHELLLFSLAALWSSLTTDHSCLTFNSPTTSLHVMRSKWSSNWQQMRTEVDEKIKAESNISILNPECVCVCVYFSESLVVHHGCTHEYVVQVQVFRVPGRYFSFEHVVQGTMSSMKLRHIET